MVFKHPTGKTGEAGAQKKINRAQEHEPKEGLRKAPAAARGGEEVGQDKRADMRGAQLGGSAAEGSHNPLRHAKEELHRQHPIAHDDHGPHHHTDHHERHEPMHSKR